MIWDVLMAMLLSITAALAPVGGGVGTAIYTGQASYVRENLGRYYLALPATRRGTLARVCGAGGCVTRRQTDVGPDQSIYPERVADLSYHDFPSVCGAPRRQGTCLVTVEILRDGPAPALPPTDTE